jgi:hypothetical protein
MKTMRAMERRLREANGEGLRVRRIRRWEKMVTMQML